MEYYARVCFMSAVFTCRCVGKFSNASRGKYSRQETHAVIIFYMYPLHLSTFFKCRVTKPVSILVIINRIAHSYVYISLTEKDLKVKIRSRNSLTHSYSTRKRKNPDVPSLRRNRSPRI